MAKKHKKQKTQARRAAQAQAAPRQTVASVSSPPLSSPPKVAKTTKSKPTNSTKPKSSKLTTSSVLTNRDLSWLALVLAAVCLVLAVGLIWLSYRPQKTLQSVNVTPIPLDVTADPNQLQSGNTPLQTGAGTGGSSAGDSAALQPQQGITPEQLKNLQ